MAGELAKYITRQERVRRIHLEFPTCLRDHVWMSLEQAYPGFTCRAFGPVVDCATLKADLTQQFMVVEVLE